MKKTSSNRHARGPLPCSIRTMGRNLRTLVRLVALSSLVACATSHFETVVEVAASKRPRTCTAPFVVKALNGWAYRVDACEGTLYYRCSYQRKSMGRSQCCHPVPDEASATSLLAPVGAASETTCQDFID
jgi:hypothetical protein